MKVVLPHSIASMFTVSPTAPLEIEPDSVADFPYVRSEGVAVMDACRTTTVPRRFVCDASR